MFIKCIIIIKNNRLVCCCYELSTNLSKFQNIPKHSLSSANNITSRLLAHSFYSFTASLHLNFNVN